MGPVTGGGSRGWWWSPRRAARRRRRDRGEVGGSSPGRSLASTKGRGEKYSSNARALLMGGTRSRRRRWWAAGRAADSIRAGSPQKNRDALGVGREGEGRWPLLRVRTKRKRPSGGVTRLVVLLVEDGTGAGAEQRQEEASAGNEPDSSNGDVIWSKLWKIKIPPKIRIFWWRAVNNFLPTKKELKRRHVEQEDFCDTCGTEGEDLYHVAFDCSLVSSFWQSAKELIGIKVSTMHPSTWTRDLLVLGRLPAADAALIICGVWSLWSGRNARKHGKESWNPRAVVRHVSTMLEDLVCSTATQEVRLPTSRSRWRRPPDDWLKINTDAAYSAATSSRASGVVIRNSHGEILVAAACAYSNILDVTMAEALAARDGMRLAIEQGAARVILEVDNVHVASLIRSQEGIRSSISGIWHEIRELSNLVTAFVVFFVHRKGNEAAHRCASMPSETSPFFCWSGSLPNWLVEINGKDCNDSLIQ
ncbi:hypothetical protein C2845_PM07G13240 [Panicum miliaceum]|uniref:RNase H type-1 domain-containing protein n=1 Tax=Panicum miliaceum TaxID=4540 RepID=A0A3L6SPT0_PANMI|nr:hypothetical protein C2845_PM07G13240 [Panicum miliaceum]